MSDLRRVIAGVQAKLRRIFDSVKERDTRNATGANLAAALHDFPKMRREMLRRTGIWLDDIVAADPQVGSELGSV